MLPELQFIKKKKFSLGLIAQAFFFYGRKNQEQRTGEEKADGKSETFGSFFEYKEDSVQE